MYERILPQQCTLQWLLTNFLITNYLLFFLIIIHLIYFFKVPTSELLKNKEWRDAVATRAFYTSETQKYVFNIYLLVC